MLGTLSALLSRTVQIVENERYNPLAGGWGAQGLLPTDRKPFSDRAGRSGFANQAEVDEGLISAGWKWDGTWEVVVDGTTDEQGWSFAPDFGWFDTGGKGGADKSVDGATAQGSTVFTTSLAEGADLLATTGSDSPLSSSSSSSSGGGGPVGGAGGVAVKSMMHFVRRRVKTRHQLFDPELLADFGAFTCDHCDLEEIERLSAVLLHALAAASLRAHPRNLTEAKCNKLKTALIQQHLSLRSGDLVPSGLYSSKVLASRLEQFAKESASAWSAVSGMVASGSPLEMLSRRTADIAQAYFSHEERRVLAGLIIRRHDLTLQYHCGAPGCGSGCEFRVERCPHDGCAAMYSAKWAGQHDAVCPQKPLPCERGCGDGCLRRLMQTHLAQACPLRPAACPYRDLGCMADLAHKDVPSHLDACMPSHLLLALARLQEQQNVIRDLHSRVGELEAGQSRVLQQAVGAAAVATAAREAVDLLAHRHERAAKEEAAAQAKKTAAVASDVQRNSGALARQASDIAAINKTLTEIKPFLASMGLGKPR